MNPADRDAEGEIGGLNMKTKTKPKSKRPKPVARSRPANTDSRRLDSKIQKLGDNGGESPVERCDSTSSEALVLGKYIVADPKICHGKVTFRGTRVFVSDVLEQVAEGMDWEEIGREWSGSVTKEAIAEALQLSRLAFLSQFARERADLEDPP